MHPRWWWWVQRSRRSSLTDILPQATSRTRICRNLCRVFFCPQVTCRIPKNSLFLKKIVAFKKVLMDWSCRPRICRTYWKYKSWGSIIVLQTQKTYLFEDCTVILVHFALSLLTSSCWFFFFVSSKSFFVSCMITLVFFSSEYLVRSCYFPPYVLPTDEFVLKIWTPARSWSPWSMIRYAIFSPITITMIVIHGHKHQVINI